MIREGRTEFTSVQLAHFLVDRDYLARDWLLRLKASEVSFLDLSKTLAYLAVVWRRLRADSQLSGRNGDQKALKQVCLKTFLH